MRGGEGRGRVHARLLGQADVEAAAVVPDGHGARLLDVAPVVDRDAQAEVLRVAREVVEPAHTRAHARCTVHSAHMT